MELSIKFNKEELILICEALRLGSIYVPEEDELKSAKMMELNHKINTIFLLQK